jgi:hypothetical protein
MPLDVYSQGMAFDEDKMSIVSSANILAYTGESTYSTSLQMVHEGIEQMIVDMTNRTFVSTTYSNELYDGEGGSRLRLKHLPITAVSRVSTDIEEVIEIKNTLTDATTAMVTVDATNVTLTVDGGAGNSTNALAIGTYTTLSSLVTAINALSSAYGWTASIYNTIYNDKKTNKLIAQQIDCTSFLTAESYQYLLMGEPVDGRIKIIDGIYIETDSYFPRGSQNIAVSYTGGAAKADITMLIGILVKAMWMNHQNSTEGLKSYTDGDISVIYEALQNTPMFRDIIGKNTLTEI